MGIFDLFRRKRSASPTTNKNDETCAYCGARGYFGRYNEDGPVCDNCFRKIAMEIAQDEVDRRH